MESNHHEEGQFLNLPSPIITDILSRLPAKTIFQCKSVCKTFFRLISEPEFVPLHHSRSPIELLINEISEHFPGFSCLNLVEIEDNPNQHNLHYVEEKKMKVPKVHLDSNTTLIGSINGLVCINEFHGEAIHIWNPTTRESITIETPYGEERVFPNIVSYGFGFSSVTNQFHVIQIFQHIDKNNYNVILKSECQVYTLGTGLWRSIGHAPFWYNCREHGVFLHENIHWLIYDVDSHNQSCEFISCLDLEKMEFRAFPSPNELIKNNLATLNIYDHQLCVCDNTSDFDIVLWTMKEYGVKESWSKEVVVSKYPIDLIGNYYEVVHVIKVFKDGEILLLWRDDVFLSYHLKRKTLISFDARDLIGKSRDIIQGLNGLPPCIEAMDYVSSVLSLKNFEIEVVKNI